MAEIDQLAGGLKLITRPIGPPFLKCTVTSFNETPIYQKVGTKFAHLRVSPHASGLVLRTDAGKEMAIYLSDVDMVRLARQLVSAVPMGRGGTRVVQDADRALAEAQLNLESWRPA